MDDVLQVCQSREEAEKLLPTYADWLTTRRMVKRYGVLVRPMIKNRPSGPWGVVLHDRKNS